MRRIRPYIMSLFNKRAKQHSSACERNKDPILQALFHFIPTDGPQTICLEISSGTGQHVVHFARHFPRTIWQPSEYDETLMSSISAYVTDSGLSNVRPPVRIDVTDDHRKWGHPDTTRPHSLDYIFNSNMMHITPYACTEGLFVNSGKLLKPNGLLFTYGPYAINGSITPESNRRFDAMLRHDNHEFGLRDLQGQLIPLAARNGLSLVETIDLPANNKLLVWKNGPV